MTDQFKKEVSEMRKRRQQSNKTEQQQQDKVLDVNASMQGTLRFDDPVNLRISGNFEGTLDTKGKLMVGEKASIKANITGEYVSVAGEVNGNIKAVKLLELDSTAKLNGDIETPAIAVREGAVLNGRLTMGQKAERTEGQRGDWMNVSQLGKYLEVSTDKIIEWASNGMLPCTKEEGEWMFERNKVDQWIAEGKVKV